MPRRLPSPRLLLLPLLLGGLLLGGGCEAPCDLASDVPGFTPQCAGATLGRYPDESRLVVLSAEGNALVAYLPAELEARPYGGTTGLPLTVEVETAQQDLLAGPPEAWLRIEALDAGGATVALDVETAAGRVVGVVDAAVEWPEG